VPIARQRNFSLLVSAGYP